MSHTVYLSGFSSEKSSIDQQFRFKDRNSLISLKTREDKDTDNEKQNEKSFNSENTDV